MFEWTTPAGDVVELLPFDTIPSGVFRKARKLDSADQIFTLLEAAASEEHLALLDELPGSVIGECFAAWSEGDAPKS